MKAYFRRLWAALCGRDFLPLSIGMPITARGPGGSLIRLEISSVTLTQDFTDISRMQIECSSPAARMVRL